MRNSNTLGIVAGSLLVALAAACEVEESLGDLPADDANLVGEGGAAGEAPTAGSGLAGSGTPGSGGTVAGSTASGGGGFAGEDPAAGAPNFGGSAGSTAQAGSTATGGATATAGSGGSSATDCLHPDRDPELGFPEGVEGCPCSREPDACVYDRSQPPWRMIAFTCLEGRWQTVEDGACDPQGTACVVDNHLYWSHSQQSFYDPFSCNACGCNNGNLTCTEINCPVACPDGTVPGQRCLDCGPVDQCLAIETGCFPACDDGDDCESGDCSPQGFCTVAVFCG